MQCSIPLTVQECFLVFRWNVLCFSLCPLPLVLSLSTTEQWLALSLFAPSLCIHCLRMHGPFLPINVTPWAFSFGLNNPCSLSLSSQEWYFSPFVFFMAYFWMLSTVSMFSIPLWSSELDTIPGVAWTVLSEACEGSPWPAGSILPNASQDAVGLLCSTLLGQVPPDDPQDLQSLFCQAAFQLDAPKHNLVHGVFPLQVQKFAVFLVNFMKFLSAHFSSLLRYLWMTAGPFGISATYPIFVRLCSACHPEN